MRRFAVMAGVALAIAALPGAAFAQRDPVYEAARQQGQIGEMMDGYLGFVGSPSADLRKVVDDLNIRRKAVYAEKAAAKRATIEEYALTAGCLAIARTAPGEKYQAPDGGWRTRGSEPPARDPRCP
ncbi:MAG: YdbL family protein [Novosphingobium sp.]